MRSPRWSPPVRRYDPRSLRRSRAGAGSSDRQRRIEGVLIDVARRVNTGAVIDPADIEREHADLLPELANDLRLLLAIGPSAAVRASVT